MRPILIINHILIYRSKRTDIPIYSFEQHQRQKETVSIYSPHIVLLEGILTLQDPRVLDMLDLKIFVEADADVCLSRRSECAKVPPLALRL